MSGERLQDHWSSGFYIGWSCPLSKQCTDLLLLAVYSIIVYCCLFNNYVSFTTTALRTYELRRMKPCIGPTQAGLYSNRKWIEARSFGFRMDGLHYLCRENKAADDQSTLLSSHMQKW